jgi:predicted transglutaminase-like cysteine proteinase
MMRNVTRFYTSFLGFILIICLIASISGCGTSKISNSALVPRHLEITTSLNPIVLGGDYPPELIIDRSYTWVFDNVQWTWELQLPQLLYDYFKDKPRIGSKDMTVYYANTFDDIYMEELSNGIKRVALDQGFNKRETVEFIAAFIQSITYVNDSTSTGNSDYPRYPLETLVDNEGDCEDTSILLASLLNNIGIEVAIIHFPKTDKWPGHYGVGISGIRGVYGTHWEYHGKTYYYLETSNKGMKIGAISGLWSNAEAELFPFQLIPHLVYDWKTVRVGNSLQLQVTITNHGMVDVNDVYVIPIYEEDYYSDLADYSQAYESMGGRQFDLSPGVSRTLHISLIPEFDMYDLLRVSLLCNSAIVEQYSYNESI